MTDHALVSNDPDVVSTAERSIIDLRGQGPLVSLGRYRYLTAHLPIPPQVHPGLLVLATPRRGQFSFEVDGRVVAASPGRFLLIRPGSTYSTGMDAQPRGELLWLLISTVMRNGDESDRASIDMATERLLSDDAVARTMPPHALRLLDTAFDEPADASDVRTAWRRSLVTAALLEMALAADRTDQRMPMHPGLRKAIDWLGSHLDGHITAAELIDASGMSNSHFYTQFADTFGTTPKDYILRAKITRAQELLVEDDASMTTIAHALGFASSQHFGTAFRRYAGVAPSEYRARALAPPGP